MDPVPRSANGFLSSLPADDFELVRPYLRTAALVPELALVEAGDALRRAYLPHSGVISLAVKLARGKKRSDRDGRPRQHLRLVLRAG